MVKAVQGVRVQIGAVFNAHFHQAHLQSRAVVEAHAVLVGLELVAARVVSHQKRQKLVHGGPNGGQEQHEANDGGLGVGVEPKGQVQLRVVEGEPKEGKHGQEVHLLNHEHLQHVAQRPMADFVAQHRLQLGHCHLLDEGVEEHDALVLEEPVQVSVGVGAAFRAVHCEELGQRKVELFGECENGVFQFALRQRLVLVESIFGTSKESFFFMVSSFDREVEEKTCGDETGKLSL